MPGNRYRELRPQVEALSACISGHFQRVRAGLDIGFASAEISQTFRQVRGGVWMTVEKTAAERDIVANFLDAKSVLALGPDGEFPFENNQFELVVLAPECLTSPMVREAHRILLGGGCLMCSVDDPGITPAGLYELLRDGFDVVDLVRPPWWKFGWGGHTLTVCARRKNWRSRRSPIVSSATPVSASMLTPRG